MSGVQARDPMLFTPESDALGVYRTTLVCPQRLKTEQGGGGVWG